jgi:flagellar motor switch protein FliN
MDAMSDDSRLMNQSEIEELFKQPKPAAPPPGVAETPSAAPDAMLAQNEIEALLASSKADHPAAATIAAQASDPSSAAAAPAAQSAARPADAGASRPTARQHAGEGQSGMAHGDIEYLFNQAQQALDSVDAPRNPGPLAGIAPFKLEEFSGAAASTEVATLELIRDVELDLKIELGRTQMYLEEVLKLRKGSVVPLDKLAGDPVDIYVNGRLIARGEVLVLNDNFCVRVAELITAEAAKAG